MLVMFAWGTELYYKNYTPSRQHALRSYTQPRRLKLPSVISLSSLEMVVLHIHLPDMWTKSFSFSRQ
jgi:hypothetical protein